MKIFNVQNKVTLKIKNSLLQFYKDESGQSTTEYVLLLLFVVVAVKQVGGQLKGKLTGILNAAFEKTEDAVNGAETE